MGEKYFKDGKLFERGGGFFGTDKELGVVKEGFFGDTKVEMHDPFEPNPRVETDWTGQVKDLTSSGELDYFLSGKRDGTRIEPDSSFSSSHGQKSREWTQEYGGRKIFKTEKSGSNEPPRNDDLDTGHYSGGGYSSGYHYSPSSTVSLPPRPRPLTRPSCSGPEIIKYFEKELNASMERWKKSKAEEAAEKAEREKRRELFQKKPIIRLFNLIIDGLIEILSFILSPVIFVIYGIGFSIYIFIDRVIRGNKRNRRR